MHSLRVAPMAARRVLWTHNLRSRVVDSLYRHVLVRSAGKVLPAAQTRHLCCSHAARPKVLVLGGYGTFGRLICERLASSDVDMTVIVAGRSLERATVLARSLPGDRGHGIALDVGIAQEGLLVEQLSETGCHTVINCCGPYVPDGTYKVASACVDAGMNYIDLAGKQTRGRCFAPLFNIACMATDNRKFVCGIKDALDDAAKKAGVVVVSGASTVPTFTNAAVDALSTRFRAIHEVEWAICPGARGPRGVGTAQSVLSYAGVQVPVPTQDTSRQWFGWLHPNVEWLHGLPYRSLACLVDVADLEVLPDRYPSLRHMFPRASLEPWSVMCALMAMAAARAAGLAPSWERLAPWLVPMSNWVFRLGTEQGGFLVTVRGPAADSLGAAGSPVSPAPNVVAGMCGVSAPEEMLPAAPVVEHTWSLYAGAGDGPQVCFVHP